MARHGMQVTALCHPLGPKSKKAAAWAYRWELSFPRRRRLGVVSLANGPGRWKGAEKVVPREDFTGSTPPVRTKCGGPGEYLDGIPTPPPTVPINISSMPAVRLIARASNCRRHQHTTYWTNYADELCHSPSRLFRQRPSTPRPPHEGQIPSRSDFNQFA